MSRRPAPVTRSGRVATDEVPTKFAIMAPYVATLPVLPLSEQRMRMPGTNGVPYRRGEIP